MMDFNTSLLRERFIIQDLNVLQDKNAPVTAVSTRMVLSLRNDQGAIEEVFSIRTQNMHSCVRMAVEILNSYRHNGSVLNRAKKFDWEKAWESALGKYEKDYNPDCWVCVYTKGHIVFQKGEHHTLLDLIENCAVENPEEYEKAIQKAEAVFQKTGKAVKIDYEGHVALAANLEPAHGRCGIISRSAKRTTIFNFTITPKETEHINYPQCLFVSAAFLEGLQIAFIIGRYQARIQYGLVAEGSEEETQIRALHKRLSHLNIHISSLENTHTIRYRPEKPDFDAFILSAEEQAFKSLKNLN